MSKKLVFLFIAMLMTLSMAAATAEIAVTDMFDRAIALPEPATRVVVLSAADCEILCALGAENTLVGRGEYCNYPQSILSVPSVQSGAHTNIEEILALEPQIVIMTDMAQSLDQVNQLENNGIKVVSTRNTGIEGAYEAITLIGTLVGKQAQAQAIVDDMKTAFDEIRAHSPNTGKTVYFEVSQLEWGLWTAGSETFMDEIAKMCGLTNAFADIKGWAAISEEQVLMRDPDYIVSIVGLPDADEEIMNRAGWKGMKAVQNGHVMSADPDAITRPGPRLKDAAQSLYEFVNGAPDAI